MAKFSCFSVAVGRKKKDKEDGKSTKPADFRNKLKTRQTSFNPTENDELKRTNLGLSSVPYGVGKNFKLNDKQMSNESPTGEAMEILSYEGEDEREENSINRNFSDFDLQARETSEEVFDNSEKNKMKLSCSFENLVNQQCDEIQTGNLSDPGVGKAETYASPKLKRSCSNLETSNAIRKMAHELPLCKTQSFEELQELVEKAKKLVDPGSPNSITTHRSADRVILKKHSSSNILPSRSRRLWWKLFLWSHRNLDRTWTAKPRLHGRTNTALNKQGGYCSDTIEPNRDTGSGKVGSPCGSFNQESLREGKNDNKIHDYNCSRFRNEVASGLWPQNQWVALSTESSSPLARIDEWIKDLQIQPQNSGSDDDNNDDEVIFPPSPQNGRSTERSTFGPLARLSDAYLTEEVLYADYVIRSLNSSSTVAHISGIGLKAIPTISQFLGLRSVNLSGNLIAQITPGSLPKGLHSLNLSRNKINAIEGLRELTHLRILDLSYNRISRIGHGLANCTILKELYLAGNKISDVEGLHRLLKLTVLDLSFNKIATTKSLGQLVANYNSLQALNLLGNPIQSNVNDDQLRKAVCSLLPKLAYLNKQPIKQQRAHEVLSDSVARAALGNSSWSSRRKALKKVSHGGSLISTRGHRSVARGVPRSRHESKGQGSRKVSVKRTPLSAHASSSHQI